MKPLILALLLTFSAVSAWGIGNYPCTPHKYIDENNNGDCDICGLNVKYKENHFDFVVLPDSATHTTHIMCDCKNKNGFPEWIEVNKKENEKSNCGNYVWEVTCPNCGKKYTLRNDMDYIDYKGNNL